MNSIDSEKKTTNLKENLPDWELMFFKHKAIIKKICASILGWHNLYLDDCVSETFIKAIEKYHQYNPDYKLSTWLGVIAKNIALYKLRDLRKNTSIDIQDLEGNNTYDKKTYLQSTIDPDDNSIEEYRRMMEIINNMPSSVYKSIFLESMEGTSNTDLSLKYGIHLTTVRVYLKRFRDDVRKLTKNLSVFKELNENKGRSVKMNKKNSLEYNTIRKVEERIYGKGNLFYVYGRINGKSAYLGHRRTIEEAMELKQSNAHNYDKSIKN